MILILSLSLTLPGACAEDMDSMIFYDSQQITQENLSEPDNGVFSPLQTLPGEVVFKQVSRRFDSLDPSYNLSIYPGGRGANKLVIYTPSFGIHTGTNEYGTEAIVEENTVTALSGADSTIPKNGIVISGHGVAKNWITQNVTVGSKVYVDIMNNNITIYTTSESYMYEAKAKIKEALSIMEYYQNNLPGYNYTLPNKHIQAAQNYLKTAEAEAQNSAVLCQYTKEAIDSANMAIRTSLPYIKDELKGTWIRPTETSKEQIIDTLDKIQEAGFNNIFLETYFHGKTIFPSQTMNKYGFTVQHEKFNNFDPLAIWISEAHKRNIKVHTWFQSFYVGNQTPGNDPTGILTLRPDWGNKTKYYANTKGATKSVSEHNGYFIDPANPEVQDFLLDLLDEIITTYHPDGINLDYIRYPHTSTGSEATSWGYTEYARNDFKALYGVDPVDLKKSDPMWLDWNQYRRNNITNFVKKAGKLCRDKNVYSSAVIFPDIATALSAKQQDWRNWSINNYIDGFTPLFLTNDSNMLVSMMNDVMRIKSPQTDLYAGLFVTFMGGAPEDLIRQIYQTRMMNVNGVIVFDFAHTTPVYTTTLMASAFNESKPKRQFAITDKPKKVAKKKENKTGKVVTTTNNKGFWVFTRQ